MLLNRFLRKCSRLLLGLSVLPCKRHPFADDCSPRVVLGLHVQRLQALVPRTFLVSGRQPLSAAAMNSPAPISTARAIPPTIERTRCLRSVGLLPAAAFCAANILIQKSLMDSSFLASARHLSVPRAPFRAGAPHVVSLGPIVV